MESIIQPDQDSIDAAFSLLNQWAIVDEADTIQPLGNAAVYKTSVVLFLMIYQRLNASASLKETVAYFFKNAPISPQSNIRIREKTLSTGSGSYSAARKRLKLEVVDWLQKQVSSSIIESTPPSFKNRRVFLIDGTTLTAFPNPAIQAAFPPASNQHGPGVWPIIYLVTAHELSSGAAMPPQIGAMYGENAIGETKLAEPLIASLPEDSIVMADAGYGIFQVAYSCRSHKKNFVLRLTKDRFESYKKKATLVRSNPSDRTYKYTWTPSAKERANNPGIPIDSSLEVTLLELKIGNEWLYLVTDLEGTPQDFRQLYFERYDVEIDIRNIKVVLDAEHFECKSVEMLRKEIGMAMVSYNLNTQLRRQAAKKAACQPRELSFTWVWYVFKNQLLNHVFIDAAEFNERLTIAINLASKQKLPNRPGRSYPRESYSKRPKTFQKRKIKPKTKESQGEEQK